MSSTESNARVYYQSLYRHGVDEKRRLQIPAKWRPAQPDVEFTLIPWPKGAWKEAFILVLPPEQRFALVEKLTAMSYADQKVQTLRRVLGSRSDQVTLDKNGRICLPEGMAKGVGIKNEAVLVGMFDRFEIWNPERYVAVEAADDESAPEALKML